MKKCRIFSILSFLLFLLSTAWLIHRVYISRLLPVILSVAFPATPQKGILFIAAILFAVLTLIIAFLVFGSKSKILTVLGGVISLILAIAFLIVSLFLNTFISKFQSNFTSAEETKTEISTICVYMRAEDSDDKTALSADMTYGILEVQDRTNTDDALHNLEEKLGSKLKVKSFDGPTSLLDALFEKDVDAIILNSVFLDLVNEMEGYENAADRLRSIDKIHLEREVPVKKPTRTRPAAQAEEGAEGKTDAKEPFIVYISGIDNRGELIEKSRSDVNIIAVVNPNSHQILLITTPRDYYVPLKFPDYVSPRDKLTHAGIYGVQVSMDTLGLLYEIDFDYYFRVNFGGFVNIVEALGGVTVNVEKEFSTTEYTFKEGPNELNGYKALSFVRNRFGIGDQQRGRNQMAFIKGLINKATSTDMLLNFNSILSAVDGSFECSMPYDVILGYVQEQVETKAEWNVVSYAVTGSGNSAIPYSMNIEVYVMDPDMDTVQTARDLIQQVLAGEVITQPK